MMVKKISAVLLNYKRPNDLRRVENDLRRYDFIDDICIWDNSKVNSIMYGRFKCMERSKHDTIYVQDDDCLVHNLRSLYIHYDGRGLVNNVKAERRHAYTGRITTLGWGAIFDRRWTSCLDKYVKRHGKDRIFLRECDRIFTMLLDKPRTTLDAQITDFPSAMDSNALSLQGEHEDTKRIAEQRCEVILNDDASSAIHM